MAQDALRASRISTTSSKRRSHCRSSETEADASLCCPVKEGAPKQVSSKALPAAKALAAGGSNRVEELPDTERTQRTARVHFQAEPKAKLQQQPAGGAAIAEAGAAGGKAGAEVSAAGTASAVGTRRSSAFRVSDFSRSVVGSGIARLAQEAPEHLEA